MRRRVSSIAINVPDRKEYRFLSDENRHEERERLSKPLFDEFNDWIDSLEALPDSLLGKAVCKVPADISSEIFT